jgi:hypothetical protein
MIKGQYRQAAGKAGVNFSQLASEPYHLLT